MNNSGLELKEISKNGALLSESEKLLPPVLGVEITKTADKARDDAIPFTEALSRTKFGLFNYVLIFVSGMVLANVLLETATMGFILPVAECDLYLTNQDKGVLSAIGFAGIIMSSHLWGFLADTKGRRKVIRPTLIAGFLVTLVSSFSVNFWMMVVLRFINGFFVSGGSATIYAYLGEFHTDKSRSRAMMGSSFIFAVGAMFVPLLAFLVINRDWLIPLPLLGIDYKPWRLFCVVCGIPGFLCGLSLYALPESPKFLLSIGKEAEAITVLEQMSRWNRNKEPLNVRHIFPEDEDNSSSTYKPEADDKNSNFITVFFRTMWRQTIPLFQNQYLRITLIVCTMQFWLYVVTNGLYMWFPHIINSMSAFMSAHPGKQLHICDIVNKRHLNVTTNVQECITKLEHKTYFYSLVMEILYAASFALLGLVINRISKVVLLFIITVFFTSCGLAAVFVPNPEISSYLYVMLFLVGVAINVLGATTVELYPTQSRAMAICISLMVGRFGSVVGANIVGALLATHCELTFYISCSALLACAFLVQLLPKKSMVEEPAKKQSIASE